MTTSIDLRVLLTALASLVTALIVSFAATPVVKIFARKVGGEMSDDEAGEIITSPKNPAE